jgi:hypothetical protein
MTIKDAIYTYLITQTGLTALVGTRIYPDGEIPQRVSLPAIEYSLVSKVQDHTSGSDAGNPYFSRWQFDCWADKGYTADDVAVQLIAALKDYSGTLGGDGGVSVNRILMENQTEIKDDELKRKGVTIDFTIIYVE